MLPAAVTETRATFADLTTWEIAFWYFLIFVSTATFFWGALRLVQKYRRGRAASRLDGPEHRVRRTLEVVFTHSWIKRRDPLAGLGHLLIFYGFLVLFAGTVILAIQDDVAKPIFGFHFYRGAFYLGYSLFLDVFGAGLVIGLAVMAVKRGVLRPFRLDYWRPDRAPGEYDRRPYVIGDWLFLAILFFLALTGFLLEAFRIAETNPSFETWSPLGWVVGQGFRELGLKNDAAADAHFVQWWVHGVVALGFVASIPFTKAVHMLTGPAAVAVRDDLAGRRLPPIPPEAKPDEVGYGVITDLSWKHLVDLDACTKCGKCHAACPATSSGYPLSPRDLILDLREQAEGAIGVRAALHLEPLHEPKESILGDPIRPETLWSCMQCMACVEICPVGIEHVPIINQLRRRLVEQGEMDSMLQQTLETIYTSGNSFGEPKRKRARWTRELDFEVKDVRKEPAEHLWFVGDYASFDPRNQRATRSLARILHHSGVDFGILFDAEKTGGCDVRRVGEEGLYASLAEENVKTISGCDFERIFSSDPHSFHTLKNEYPQFGGSWTVLHHSQLLLELIESGRLVPRKPLGYRVTYHDPCTLGRYNGVYDAPRQVLRAVGIELAEMPRNRDNSFCCGAGGGRIWMKELRKEGSPRPSEMRIDEAVALGGIDYFVVACPKDVTMYEDAIKTSGHQGDIELRELSELVLESLGLDEQEPAGDAVVEAPAQ
ncbi:MAG: 4Fe-4S dicluster domain-containing protein [Actinobacteria bacterium]|nr:MAG: 4Fe-4S dicluster domain-containing protein [Actinomycetota bacterium]